MEATIIKIDEKDIILIGFSTIVQMLVNGEIAANGKGNPIYERKIVINPKSSSEDQYSKNYRFKERDTIFLISYEQPEVEQYFKNRAE